jgi:hypothetical protein
MGRSSIAVAAAIALGLVSARGRAQESPQPARPEAAKAESESQKAEPRTPLDLRCTPGAALRVQVLITRVQQGKKEASLPYTFVVSARPSSTCPTTRVRMRMGVDTPVPVMGFDNSGKMAGRSVQYKTVGTNIDCSADDLGDGRYKLLLTVENSSALPGDKAAGGELAEYPLFRRFEMSLDPILRDGQKAETVSSTDPVTGEVVKIDVSLNVVK